MKIVLKNISQTFTSLIGDNFDAISNVSLEINQGEFIGVIGMTGSGKTTLIEHLNALLIPTKGEIEFNYKVEKIDKKTKASVEVETQRIVKKSWKKIKKINEIRKLVGVVFQFAEYQLFEETIEKDIIFGPINMGISKDQAKQNAKEVIESVGLDQSYLQRSPFELSGGQKRRVALAGILAMQPDILVFDEPTAGLDPEGAKDMLRLFRKLNKSGKTIVIVTHNLDDVLEFTDRTILLNAGKVVADGNTLDILSNSKLLLENNMDLPKIIEIIDEINQSHKTNIPYVKTIDELAAIINDWKENRRKLK